MERIKKTDTSGPLVSIITVTLNPGAQLLRCLDSVTGQTYPNVEHIVVDGGSTDGTRELLAKREGLRWLSEPDKGIGDAFNKGISMAKGQLLGILNADDFYEPDAVERAVKRIGVADVVHGPIRYWKGERLDCLYHPNDALLERDMTIGHPSVFVTRQTYEQWGVFDTTLKYAMDYELVLRFKRQGARFATEKLPMANMSLDGMSDRNWYKGYWEVARAQWMHLGNDPRIPLRLTKHLVRSAARRILESVGLVGLVDFYRRRCAMVKKDRG
ncbi:MAG: glycosyltransferase [Okeania sp. SIO3B3]|nr:glycosyltransferase [Okeania sp. SIO3B3]